MSELKNAVVRSPCLAESDEIGVKDLPEGLQEKPSGPDPMESAIEAMEQQAIYRALMQAGASQDRAAQSLGISKGALMRKLKSYRAAFDAVA